jgi:hypothetical protein
MLAFYSGKSCTIEDLRKKSHLQNYGNFRIIHQLLVLQYESFSFDFKERESNIR